MKIYLVGGAVRDMVLGIPSHDKDYVVVGATPDELLSLGYKQVGKDFPVFLHPKTKEEYALARKELPSGKGHRDFAFEFTPDITLEDDLIRREFTCNALAYDEKTQQIIDIFGGIADIKNRTLRHISSHFSEDPLRVLRACRFAAQLDFTIAEPTIDLCRHMVASGALSRLSAERIWQEFFKALNTNHFSKFINTMQQCNAWKAIVPELSILPDKLTDLDNEEPLIKWAILLQKLSPDERKNICRHLRTPMHYAEFANLCADNLIYFQQINGDDCSALFDLVCKVSSKFKKLKQLQDFLQFCRYYCAKKTYLYLSNLCLKTYDLLKNVKATDMANFHDLTSSEIAEAYKEYRINLLKDHFKSCATCG